MAFDYAAAPSVARAFIREFRRSHCDLVETIVDIAEDMELLPRLPCERLFC
ncbi:hypothetical protein [Nocardia sp. NPDC051570]|uniref:hypothetical protein n=1 Tax=Nocardia sp. NPDC051570 TaxID=3364324 RepID=UPI0037B36120